MSEDAKKMSCEAFQAQLPELIASGENVNAHPHLESCELCRALLADLESIAEAARQLFPIEEPPDDLWDHIESAIKKEEADKKEVAVKGSEVGGRGSEEAGKDEDGGLLSLDGMGLPQPE
jgi:hypothetical protein